jgi:hypothetical protein
MGSPKYGYLGRMYPLEDVENLSQKRLQDLREFAASRLQQNREGPRVAAAGV